MDKFRSELLHYHLGAFLKSEQNNNGTVFFYSTHSLKSSQGL